MPTTLLVMQDERTLALPLGTTSSLIQENMNAASILNYQFILPMIRVVRSADNALNTTGVEFTFLTAPVLSAPDDEQAKGARFLAVGGYKVTVAPAASISGPGVNGQTFVAAATSGVIPAITNPGGLLLWKCANLDNANPNTLRFEIHLICRGP